MTTHFPVLPEDLTPAFLSKVISDSYPGTEIRSVKITDAKGFGEGSVSTSGRVNLELDYASSPTALPTKILVKMTMADEGYGGTLYGLYENEVNFYKGLRNEVDVETPMGLGGLFDHETNRYVLLLEDLCEKDVYFPCQLDESSIENIKNILNVLAKLHAKFWDSPRFNEDLSWVETHTEGRVADVMRTTVRGGIQGELASHKFKRETLGRLGTTEEKLYEDLCALQKHQATLPRTLLHGDCHFGNTYRLPDGKIGLYDWQLCVHGFCLHDITYLIITTLSIAQRRKYDRELLAYYRDQLISNGVSNPPDMDTLWLEYRRAAHWCFNIGWLTCPTTGYGWELLIIAFQRTSAAYEDLGTLEAIQELQSV